MTRSRRSPADSDGSPEKRRRASTRIWNNESESVPAYRVELQPSAERDLDRLAPTLLTRVAERIQALAADPRPPGSVKLVGSAMYRVRVGDHRIVYEGDDAARAVFIVRVRHRREVYRRLG